MLKAKTLIVRLEEKIEIGLNVWLLKNKEKDIRFFQQTHIPPEIIPIDKEDPIKRERGMEKAAYSERRGYFMYTILFEE